MNEHTSYDLDFDGDCWCVTGFHPRGYERDIVGQGPTLEAALKDAKERLGGAFRIKLEKIW